MYIMKYLVYVIIIAVTANSAAAQTLFTVGNTAVTTAEFLRAYSKNKPASVDKQQAIKDYIELYTNFKLKVKAAQALQLDTSLQIKYDVQNFKDQVSGNYLNDEAAMKFFIDEAVSRSYRNLHVLYFSVPIAENASPADTLLAYNTANNVYATLKNGNTNYSNIVTDASTGKAVAKWADVGYITAFTLPYQLENEIYNTAVNDISKPLRTKKGYKFFKIVENLPDAGVWKVAQILLAFPPNADAATKQAVKLKADSVYNLLKQGLNFKDAALMYSNDRTSYQNGGEVREFAAGAFNIDFEKNVFALSANNQLSKPFETEFGYHIVKRISQKSLPIDKKDAAYKFEIKQKISESDRSILANNIFIQNITPKTGFVSLQKTFNKDLLRFADSTLVHPTYDNTLKQPVSNLPLFKFKDGTIIKGSQWLQFVRSNSDLMGASTKVNMDMWQNYTNQAILDYYKKNLLLYSSEFKNQMQEFLEGNMLFEIMERNVWSKAASDTVALQQYFTNNKASYTWAESADVIIFNCSNSKSANLAKQLLLANYSIASIIDSSQNKVQADSGRYELAQLQIGNKTNFTQNFITAIAVNDDSTASFSKIIRTYPANQPRSFAEAKGLVINDYQALLEKQWVSALRKKYTVKINEVELNKLLKQ